MREWHNPPSPINRSRKRRGGGGQQHLHSQPRQGGEVREDALREGGEAVVGQIPVVAQGKGGVAKGGRGREREEECTTPIQSNTGSSCLSGTHR